MKCNCCGVRECCGVCCLQTADLFISLCSHKTVEVGNECPVKALPLETYGPHPNLKLYDFFRIQIFVYIVFLCDEKKCVQG